MASSKKKIALEVNNISKSFKLPTEQANGIKQAFVNYMKGVKGYKEQQVLKNISFQVEEGDFFGIVGRNGSGKSTLLKLISQIYVPDEGRIKVNGKLVPFIELGVGFNHELTGRENVYLNGALLGFSHEEVNAMYDDIVEFAELNEFMDQKLKNYSSGMQVRLAFSIAIKAEADILVLDEVLAVGDEAFQRKCYEYFAYLKKTKKTVILVTHAMDNVLRFCNKAALIDKGHKFVVGNPSEIAQMYRGLNMPDAENDADEESNFQKIGSKSKYIEARAECTLNADTVSFNVSIKPRVELKDAVLTFVIRKSTGEPVYRWTSDEKGYKDLAIKKDAALSLRLELQNIFEDGLYGVQVGIKKYDRTEDYLLYNDIVTFEVVNKSEFPSDVHWKPKEKYNITKGTVREKS